jgi:hypothetical protein
MRLKGLIRCIIKYTNGRGWSPEVQKEIGKESTHLYEPSVIAPIISKILATAMA